MKVAAVVDSRNVFHQVGDLCGVRTRPTVTGVKRALGRYGLAVDQVQVGLALPRARDRAALSQAASENEAYRTQVLTEGGEVLLGELHRKPTGAVEEKMVDVACAVRVTRHVEEIRHDRSDLGAVIVLSHDSDLSPAYEHARAHGVALVVAGGSGIQYRPHPYLLLGPHAYAEMCPGLGFTTGHEIRGNLARTLDQAQQLTWEVAGGRRRYLIHRPTGMIGVASAALRLPPAGTNISLYPTDVTWDEKILGSFPILVLDKRRPTVRPWGTATVLSRPAPVTLRMLVPTGCRWSQGSYPLGGVVAGDKVVIHVAQERIIGPLAVQPRTFDPDTPGTVRVVRALPKGGAIAIGSDGRRGLLNTNQQLTSGQIMPVMQLDEALRGPVWAAIGTPLPS